MDKAPVYGTGDSGFESLAGLFLEINFFLCPQRQDLRKWIHELVLGRERSGDLDRHLKRRIISL